MPTAKVPIREDQAVGFDMVLEPPNFLVRSDGEEVRAPRYYRALARTKHAKSWLDAAFGELLRQVEYKARWNSKHFVQVSRFFPSTKQCFECGYKKDDL